MTDFEEAPPAKLGYWIQGVLEPEEDQAFLMARGCQLGPFDGEMWRNCILDLEQLDKYFGNQYLWGPEDDVWHPPGMGPPTQAPDKVMVGNTKKWGEVRSPPPGYVECARSGTIPAHVDVPQCPHCGSHRWGVGLYLTFYCCDCRKEWELV